MKNSGKVWKKILLGKLALVVMLSIFSFGGVAQAQFDNPPAFDNAPDSNNPAEYVDYYGLSGGGVLPRASDSPQTAVRKVDSIATFGGVLPGIEDVGDALGFLSGQGVSGDDRVTSFTDFQGELAPPDEEGYAEGLTQATDARSYILNVTNFALGFLGLIAVVIVIYGGITYVISAGDPEKAGKGKKAILFAAIGLIIVMGSFALVNTILQAPSDNEGGGGAGGSQTAVRGVAGRERYNFLAIQMEEVMLDLASSYEFNFTVKGTLQNLRDNLLISAQSVQDACRNVSFVGYCQNWNNGIESEILGFKSDLDAANNIINNFISSPQANSVMIDQMNKLVTDLNEAYRQAYNSAVQTARSTECDNTLGILTCEPSEARSILDEFNSISSGIEKSFNEVNILLSFQSDLSSTTNQVAEIKENVTDEESGVVLAREEFTTIESGLQSVNTASSTELVIGKAINKATFNALTNVLAAMNEVAQLLRQLEFVDVVLTADTRQGNAPLAVNFSTVGSSDPSGLTITDIRIQWDLNGDGDFNSQIQDNDRYLECNEEGNATASCIFREAGTYRVRVKILPDPESNEFIAPGFAFIDIKVNPPATKINLKATTFNAEDYVIQYEGDSDFPTKNKSSLYVTLPEAQSGITFDASETVTRGGNPIEGQANTIVEWNFGVPSPNNDLKEAATVDGSLRKVQSYSERGSYLVRLNITDNNNVTDSKIFNVVVSDLAPRITNPSTSTKVGEPVRFDGSKSSSSGQASPQFVWTINKIERTGLLNLINKAIAQSVMTFDASGTADTEIYTCKKVDGSMEIIECSFKEAGDYMVSLALETEDGTSSPIETTTIRVSSNEPVPGFISKQVDKSIPAVYTLDARGLSYDPDHPADKEKLEYSWDINTANCVYLDVSPTSSGVYETDAIRKAATQQESAQLNCDELKVFENENSAPVVKFTDKGTYNVRLQVRSADDQFSVSEVTEQTINVPKVLSVFWGNMKPTAILSVPNDQGGDDQDPDQVNPDPFAEVEFLFASPQAVSWEMDFGDGDIQAGEFDPNLSEQSVTHNYYQTGKYEVSLTVYDADDVENTINRNVFIGDADSPIAVIGASVNSVPVEPTTVLEGTSCEVDNAILVTKSDNVVFNSERSVNTDGTGRRMRYSWNINNGEKRGTQNVISHQFRDITECGESIPVTLTATNERDVTQKGEDSVNVVVQGLPPVIRGITAIADDSNNFVTPVRVNVEAIGAEDEDGRITQYRWWYYQENRPEERLGVQITTTPRASMVIGTNGDEGDEITYGFGVEVTDDNNNISTTDTNANEDDFNILENVTSPTIEVINGPNKPPIASFTVDRTNVFTGEPVNFVSSSSDPDEDGGITEYIWDFGDGNFGENRANVTHVYDRANSEGYIAKLTVRDEGGSEATAPSIRIYVDGIAEPPTAAFTSDQTKGQTQVRLTDNSSADEANGAGIESRAWDCNVNKDADGDGFKDNDVEGTGNSIECEYEDFGIYRARLTVTDDLGQTDFVTNFINLRAPEPPPAPATTNDDLGANIYKASNKVDLGLLLASIGAYGILLIISRKGKKQTAKSKE
ncbi:PKD domain-containing protein [Candidatus Peregrinibacteria bacterium]|nr:PKD domain-containing protein [Candidatus Peregrinibacteria bacterium]